MKTKIASAMELQYNTGILLFVLSFALISGSSNDQQPLEGYFSHVNRDSNNGIRKLLGRTMVPQGVSKPFCNMFGCNGCQPPPGARCCQGYAYDSKANKCRETVTFF